MTKTISPDISSPTTQPRNLEWWEWRQLREQGCSSVTPESICITDATDLSLIHNIHFEGSVRIGALSRDSRIPSGRMPGLRNAEICDCTIGDNVLIANIPSGIRNASVGNGAEISNVARIDFEPEAPCGVGVTVNILDESGSRPVRIYPGLSAQMAALQARMPTWVENHFRLPLQEHLDSFPIRHEIGENAVVADCGPLTNVFVDREVRVEGASRLSNGSIINNAAPGRALSFVGAGVDARNFIFEDARVEASAIVRNCYAGQGASLDKGFTAHDSLFFANSAMENGEACALFAGPYSVSMHKSSLLIGCQTSFMNAGSASNQSNHMYKMGPVHWGVLERGVKTSSNSYLMLGADIGAFSLLMGDHKTHPDSTMFPFSYLFGDERGATVVVPAQMLRSCGLMRDEKKWPTRDKRLKRRMPLHDRIHFNVLSPFTVERMLGALPIIDALLIMEPGDDRYVRWRGMKFSRASLERARNLYTIAVFKYLHTLNPSDFFSSDIEAASPKQEPTRSSFPYAEPSSLLHAEPSSLLPENEWIDLAGQLMPRTVLQQALEAESVVEIEDIFNNAFEQFHAREAEWVARRFDSKWRRHPAVVAEYAAEFDRQVDQDRRDYLASLSAETASLDL